MASYAMHIPGGTAGSRKGNAATVILRYFDLLAKSPSIIFKTVLFS